MITEYAAATFGARIQTSPYGARKLIADAIDLHHRLPKLNAGIAAGTVRVGHARHVAEATRDLTPEQAAWVDAEVVEVADGRLGWKRFEALVEGKVAAASPELARAKEEAAARDRYARVSRVNRHGIATLTIRDHAPARLREAVHLVHPGDVFPFATNTSRSLDLDHLEPYSEGGPTSTSNLAPQTRTHHRIKTHTAWKVRQPFPGIIVWRDPHGAHYLVDNTGTRRINGPPGDPPVAA